MATPSAWFPSESAAQVTVRRSALPRVGPMRVYNVRAYRGVARRSTHPQGSCRSVVEVAKCGHDHVKQATAVKCAVTLARRLNREAVTP